MIRVIFRPAWEFGMRSDIAIHLLRPSDAELQDARSRAESAGFTRIVVYA
jgi:hypothetical protein